MPTSLNFEQHLAALADAGARLVTLAEAAGLDVAVPTCPTWTNRELLAHQTMVHRWAAAQVRGEDADGVPNQTTIAATEADLPAYYRAGLSTILDALRESPADLTAMTFLNDAPAPRAFWARRQAHETTMHMVDALAASLGRVPSADEAAIGPAFAADGLDELLRGFFTRGRSKLYDGQEYTIVVAPTDVPRRFVVRVAERLTVDADDPASGPDAAAQLSGTAAQLYLALWNRGDEVALSGDPAVLDRWRETQRVRWS